MKNICRHFAMRHRS